MTRSRVIRSSAASGSKMDCNNIHPPAVRVDPSAQAKLPDQKNPFGVQQRTSSWRANNRRHRHRWIAMPRCELMMPFDVAVEPEEKRMAPLSVGFTVSAVRSASSAEMDPARSRNPAQLEKALPAGTSPISARKPTNHGYFGRTLFAGTSRHYLGQVSRQCAISSGHLLAPK